MVDEVAQAQGNKGLFGRGCWTACCCESSIATSCPDDGCPRAFCASSRLVETELAEASQQVHFASTFDSPAGLGGQRRTVMGREGRRGKVPIRALAVSNVVYSKQTSIKVTARVLRRRNSCINAMSLRSGHVTPRVAVPRASSTQPNRSAIRKR